MTESNVLESGRQPGKWTWFILPMCIIAAMTVLIGLGNWQMQRLAWKDGLIARVEKNLNGPPATLQEISEKLAGGKDVEYLPVKLRGTFRHDLEQYFFTTFKGTSGWAVYTPLERADGSVVFVNRGFVPMLRKDPQLRQEGQIKGVVDIIGLARSAPAGKPNSFVPDNDLVKNVYYWKSLPQMISQTGYDKAGTVLPFFVDVKDTPLPGGLPIGGITIIIFPNSHLQYALTWYGLAGALLVVGGIFMFKRRTESAPE